MKRFLSLLLLLLSFAVSTGKAESVTHAVLLEIDAFAFRSQLSVAAENNVWTLAQTLANSDPIPQMTLAFGKGGSEANPLMYSPKVNTPEALDLLLQEAFGDTAPEDVLLLYICTHGVYEEGSFCGLVLSDGIQDSLLTGEQLAAMLDRYPCKKILILDACHSGGMIGFGGKGENRKNPFSEDVSILTSSRATEDSWYWIENDGQLQGSFFFTNQLCLGLSPSNGIPADENKDGKVTLSELYSYLLEYHGASTPMLVNQRNEVFFQTPSDSGLPAEPVRDIVFSSDYSVDGHMTMEMTAFRPLSIAYRIAVWEESGWNLSNAQIIYDDSEAYGSTYLAGGISPGRKMRSLDFAGTESDYVLVQIITNEEGKLSTPASHVVALIEKSCELSAEAYVEENGCLHLRLEHEKPAVFTVYLKGDNLEKRVLTRCASRPSPDGSSEYVFEEKDYHGICYFQVEALFSGEKTVIVSNQFEIP